MEIAFLPWVGPLLIDIGPVKLRPYRQVRSTIPGDAQVFLDQYFRCYRDARGHSIDNVSLCFPGEVGSVELFDETAKSRIRQAIDCLIFSSIFKGLKNSVRINDQSWAPPTSDQFTLYVLSFEPGDNYYSLLVGGMQHIYSLDQFRAVKPLSTGGALVQVGMPILRGLGSLLRRRGECARRMLRSLEWFRWAHYGGESISDRSRVVMMATAFEILLSLPEQQKTKNFVESVNMHLCHPGFRRGTRTTRSGNKYAGFCFPALWAGQFYELRSQIVHGDKWSYRKLRYTNRYQAKEEKWVTHLIIADLVYSNLVVKLGDQATTGEFHPKPASKRKQSSGGSFDWVHRSWREAYSRLGWLRKRL